MITAVAVEIKRKANKTGERSAGLRTSKHRDKNTGKPGFRKQRTGLWNGAKKQRPLRFTPETAFIHSITIQLLKRYAGSSHLST